MPEPSVEGLLSIDDSGVRRAVRDTFVGQLCTAPSVHAVFFSDALAPVVWPVDPVWMDRMASALMCWAIGQSSLHGFADTVDWAKAGDMWRGGLGADNTQAHMAVRALYDWAFAAHAMAGGLPFQTYLDSTVDWHTPLGEARARRAHIQPGRPATTVVNPRQATLWGYVLARLSPGFDRMPSQTSVAMSGPHPGDDLVLADEIDPSRFLVAANCAIHARSAPASDAQNSAGMYERGAAVRRFLHGLQPKTDLVARTPAPVILHDPPILPACFTEQTVLHLEDAKTSTVAALADRATMPFGHNQTVPDSVETTAHRLSDPVLIYGINDGPPFFTGAQVLMTDAGPKAIAPDAARAVNPEVGVVPLRIGDIVLRLRSLSPFVCDRVTVTALPSRQVAPGETLHEIVLHAGGSFHANGYAMAINQPDITEARLSAGFACLAPGEQDDLRRRFETVMPMLRHALGDWIQAPMQRALSPTDADCSDPANPPR